MLMFVFLLQLMLQLVLFLRGSSTLCPALPPLDDPRRDELLQELRKAASRRRLLVGHVVRLDRLEELLDELHDPRLLRLV